MKKKRTPVISIEAARLRRWERKRDSPFQPKQDLNWICRCGCWQYEVKPEGVFCLGCNRKQEMVVNPIK